MSEAHPFLDDLARVAANAALSRAAIEYLEKTRDTHLKWLSERHFSLLKMACSEGPEGAKARKVLFREGDGLPLAIAATLEGLLSGVLELLGESHEEVGISETAAKRAVKLMDTLAEESPPGIAAFFEGENGGAMLVFFHPNRDFVTVVRDHVVRLVQQKHEAEHGDDDDE